MKYKYNLKYKSERKKLRDSIAEWIIGKIATPECGWCHVGRDPESGEAIRFYRDRKTGRSLLGSRTANFYYGELDKMGSWTFFMSRYLPWGTTDADGFIFDEEPEEIPFSKWRYHLIQGDAEEEHERTD